VRVKWLPQYRMTQQPPKLQKSQLAAPNLEGGRAHESSWTHDISRLGSAAIEGAPRLNRRTQLLSPHGLPMFQRRLLQRRHVLRICLVASPRKEAIVLKITQRVTPVEGTIVVLEGKLLEPWVTEVRALFSQRVPPLLPRLDLSALTFVDAAGIELLQNLLREGVAVESCSAFVATLLRLNDEREVRRPDEQ
jgi:hypothetical protein